MYDRIKRGANLYGALAYLAEKMSDGKADLLCSHRVALPLDPRRFDLPRAVRSFDP